MKLVSDLPPPPDHLNATSRQWWETVVATFVLEASDLILLQLAAEALDRCQSAREQISREGLTISGRQGLKPNPAAAIARDSALVFSRLLKELNLGSVSPPASDRVGPPPIFSRGRHVKATG
jgi:P27 family predicted phage terminase small subunit